MPGFKIKVEKKDHGWAKMMAAAVELARPTYVKVGVLADTEKGGMHEPGGDLTVAEIAAIQEYGTEDGRVPERSFVRSTFEEQREALSAMAAKLLAEVVFGDLKRSIALDRMGAKLASDIKAKITQGEGVPPPNAPATVLAKLGGKFGGELKTLGEALAQVGAAAAVRPLVDSAHMLNAITWAVVTK